MKSKLKWDEICKYNIKLCNIISKDIYTIYIYILIIYLTYQLLKKHLII